MIKIKISCPHCGRGEDVGEGNLESRLNDVLWAIKAAETEKESLCHECRTEFNSMIFQMKEKHKKEIQDAKEKFLNGGGVVPTPARRNHLAWFKWPIWRMVLGS